MYIFIYTYMEAVLINRILDLIYPSSLYCMCCGRIIDNSMPYNLCGACLKNIRWATGRTCVKCGKILGENNPSDTCYNCREKVHYFDKGYTCTEYGMYEKTIIFSLKYSRKTYLANIIAEIMHDRLEVVSMTEYLDMIIPVPLHIHKEKKRGFNQAALIGRRLSELENIPYREDIVRRVQDTKAMKALAASDRMHNVKSAFELYVDAGSKIKDKRILIVDDIYTTGATMDAIAVLLKNSGATRVEIISFAAGADILSMVF